ncbi:MAG: hypothetical protein KatS3mg105_4999 [Gemmatales bacterium]|nr:MAG: hypothetical protein KatS3mg105_4999 [Gemmatales bacterium]
MIQMAAFAAREVEREAVPPQARLLLAVGIRVAARLEDAGHRLDTTLPVAASTVGITPLVGQLLVHLDRWHTQRHVDRVLVFYSEHISRAAYEPRRLDLLPIDRRWLDRLQQQPWPTRTLPTFNMDPDRLFFVPGASVFVRVVIPGLCRVAGQ